MKEKVKHIISRFHPKQVTALFEVFLKDESIGGKLIVIAAILSLIVVNSPLSAGYNHFWHLPFSIGIGGWVLALDMREWVNEGLMAFFFLIVGLEIKREFVKGELQDRKTAILPIGAAVGGMVFPALIYLLFNYQTDAIRGWGIPIATDIAFAVAILSLLGKRVPVSLKIFLLTLAVADDIGAILVIALFYAEIINYYYLFISVSIALGVFLFRKQLVDKLPFVVMAGVLLWFTTHASGVHASIIGAVMGLLAPVSKQTYKVAITEKIERLILPISTFVVLPLFAFANAGFLLNTNSYSSNYSILWGVVLGLMVGKVAGITLATWLLTRLGVASLPSNVKWSQIIGVGFMAGIGFTVSIFITELAFAGNQGFIDAAKVSVFIASIASAIIGSALFIGSHRTSRPLND